jgi:hypothetical protein
MDVGNAAGAGEMASSERQGVNRYEKPVDAARIARALFG